MFDAGALAGFLHDADPLAVPIGALTGFELRAVVHQDCDGFLVGPVHEHLRDLAAVLVLGDVHDLGPTHGGALAWFGGCRRLSG